MIWSWPQGDLVGIAATSTAATYVTLRYVLPLLSVRRGGSGGGNGNGDRSSRIGDLNPAEFDARIVTLIIRILDERFENLVIKREAESNRRLQILLREELRRFYGLKGRGKNESSES